MTTHAKLCAAAAILYTSGLVGVVLVSCDSWWLRGLGVLDISGGIIYYLILLFRFWDELDDDAE